MSYQDTFMERSKVESSEKWRELQADIPSLNFKPEWGIKIIPPFGGAVARFIIMKDKEFVCSVYLDWYSVLGCMDKPYYELYPFEDDVKRYYLNETNVLLQDIDTLFNEFNTI